MAVTLLTIIAFNLDLETPDQTQVADILQVKMETP